MAHVAIRHFSPLSLPSDRASLAQEILPQLSSRLAAFPILTFQAAGQLILDVDLFDHFHLVVPKHLFLRFLISGACIEGKHGCETSSIARTSIDQIPAHRDFS
jgi:hypothetical protein